MDYDSDFEEEVNQCMTSMRIPLNLRRPHKLREERDHMVIQAQKAIKDFRTSCPGFLGHGTVDEKFLLDDSRWDQPLLKCGQLPLAPGTHLLRCGHLYEAVYCTLSCADPVNPRTIKDTVPICQLCKRNGGIDEVYNAVANRHQHLKELDERHFCGDIDLEKAAEEDYNFVADQIKRVARRKLKIDALAVFEMLGPMRWLDEYLKRFKKQNDKINRRFYNVIVPIYKAELSSRKARSRKLLYSIVAADIIRTIRQNSTPGSISKKELDELKRRLLKRWNDEQTWKLKSLTDNMELRKCKSYAPDARPKYRPGWFNHEDLREYLDEIEWTIWRTSRFIERTTVFAVNPEAEIADADPQDWQIAFHSKRRLSWERTPRGQAKKLQRHLRHARYQIAIREKLEFGNFEHLLWAEEFNDKDPRFLKDLQEPKPETRFAIDMNADRILSVRETYDQLEASGDPMRSLMALGLEGLIQLHSIWHRRFRAIAHIPNIQNLGNNLWTLFLDSWSDENIKTFIRAQRPDYHPIRDYGKPVKIPDYEEYGGKVRQKVRYWCAEDYPTHNLGPIVDAMFEDALNLIPHMARAWWFIKDSKIILGPENAALGAWKLTMVANPFLNDGTILFSSKPTVRFYAERKSKVANSPRLQADDEQRQALHWYSYPVAELEEVASRMPGSSDEIDASCMGKAELLVIKSVEKYIPVIKREGA